MSRFLSLVILLLLLGGFGAAVYWSLNVQAAAGKEMPEFSVYSEEANGLAQTARLLRKLGWEPVAVTRPIQHTRHQGLLIVVDPQGASELTGSEISEADAQALVHWVEEGNTLLLAGRQVNAIHSLLGVAITSDVQENPGSVVTTVTPGAEVGYTEGVRQLVVEGRDSLQAKNGIPLWWQGDQPGAVLLGQGKGQVLVVPDPSLLTLRGLWRGDNARFLYNVARLQAQGGKVYFDEYHHGFESGGGFWGYLRYYEQQWMLLQGLLIVLVAVWAVGIRLGPAVPRPRELQADAVDYASAVARIYQRAGVRKLLARALVRDFRTALTRHLHLRRSALPAEMLAAWRQQHRDLPGETSPEDGETPAASADRLRELLRGMMQLGKRDISERRLLAWTRAFDHFKDEVLRVR
ncbi:MAG: DUF4350 domain-containing protein [Planctomycetes bacterium]|nr:DUF4350 domain-containing protein [Planctomycetota bacterium]